MKIAGVGEGDEVITPPNSFVASTATIIQLGAKPVFADVLADQNIDPEKIAKRDHASHQGDHAGPSHRTHLARWTRSWISPTGTAWSSSRTPRKRSARCTRAGSRARSAISACFSAHPLKNLNALGDGGFVTTNDKAAAERMRRLRAHGMADRATIEEWGMVSRMDTLQAAAILELPPREAARRDCQAARQCGALPEAAASRAHVRADLSQRGVQHLPHLVVQVDKRDELQAHLRRSASRRPSTIRCRFIWQPAARALGHKAGDFPMTERQAERILTPPGEPVHEPGRRRDRGKRGPGLS